MTIEVVVQDRAYEAHQLRVAGMSWPDVAARVGYLDARVASTAVNTYLQKIAVAMAPEQRQQALHLELDRLDALQLPYWDPAMDGDLGAANFVLKLFAQRAKLLGLDRADTTPQERQTSILISDDTNGGYLEGLTAIARARNPEMFGDAVPDTDTAVD